MFLLADIGGTNARFALCSDGAIHSEKSVPCANFPDIDSAIRAYLSEMKAAPMQGAIAVAAPLHGDLVRMTNHVWQFSVRSVCREVGLQRLIVLNDFTALALSLRHLPTHELQQVGGGPSVPNAPIALIGAGTGLGVSGLIPTGEHWLPLQGEGGHVTLAASNDREAAALAIVRSRYGHVSAERVLSGPGLLNLYESLCKLDNQNVQFTTPAEVTEHGLLLKDERARETLDMFCSMLGVVTGNLVLTLGAVGGVFIGGGIVPRFKGYFAQSPFRRAFEDKGRYAIYLAPVPVHVIHSEWPAFVGLSRAFVDPSPRVEAVV